MIGSLSLSQIFDLITGMALVAKLPAAQYVVFTDSKRVLRACRVLVELEIVQEQIVLSVSCPPNVKLSRNYWGPLRVGFTGAITRYKQLCCQYNLTPTLMGKGEFDLNQPVEVCVEQLLLEMHKKKPRYYPKRSKHPSMALAAD
jgi:hypothetical protein